MEGVGGGPVQPRKYVFPFAWLLLGNFFIFAYCGLVGNPHLAAKIYLFAPLPTSAKLRMHRHFWTLRFRCKSSSRGCLRKHVASDWLQVESEQKSPPPFDMKSMEGVPYGPFPCTPQLGQVILVFCRCVWVCISYNRFFGSSCISIGWRVHQLLP